MTLRGSIRPGMEALAAVDPDAAAEWYVYQGLPGGDRFWRGSQEFHGPDPTARVVYLISSPGAPDTIMRFYASEEAARARYARVYGSDPGTWTVEMIAPE